MWQRNQTEAIESNFEYSSIIRGYCDCAISLVEGRDVYWIWVSWGW